MTSTVSEQKAKLSSIEDKIVKLIAHAESAESIGSIAEAEAFQAKVSELCEQYGIERERLYQLANEKGEAVEQEKVGKDETYLSTFGPSFKNPPMWVWSLLSACCKGHNCRVIRWRNSDRVSIIGYEKDRALTKAMFLVLYRDAQTAWNQAKRDQAAQIERNEKMRGQRDLFTGEEWEPEYIRPLDRTSFLHGYAGRINERYSELEKQRHACMDDSSQALVRVSVNKVAQAEKEFYPNARKSSWQQKGGNGYSQGRAAGDRANLSASGMGGSRSSGSLGKGRLQLGS